MNLADRITASRLAMAPVFFALFAWGAGLGLSRPAVSVLLWILFAAIELSDLLDGQAARARGTVSAFGKLFDPFADVFARLTYFLCFTLAGLMPAWILLVILYREFSQLFLRMLLAEKGIAMGARPGGKLKAVFYMLAGMVSLAAWTAPSFGLEAPAGGILAVATRVLYLVALFLSVGSFVDYLVQFRRLTGSSRT